MSAFVFPSSRTILRTTLLAVTTVSLMACGNASFNKKQKRSGSNNEQLAGAADEGCLALGQGPGQYPGQGPGYDNGGGGGVIVVPPGDGYKGEEPPPPPPGKGGNPPPNYPSQPNQPCGPGQYPNNPGQQPCGKGYEQPCGGGDVYRPIDQDDDYVPGPYPTQHPIEPGQCGKGGKYCDDGGPGQWPGQTVGGKPYSRGDVEACLGAYRAAGYNTQGMWGIEVNEVKAVNVLSESTISDFGLQPKIVIIKSVGVLGRLHFELVNPNALYCIKSNVSVLQETLVTSCRSSNVLWGKDVNVLSKVATRIVDCR